MNYKCSNILLIMGVWLLPARIRSFSDIHLTHISSRQMSSSSISSSSTANDKQKSESKENFSKDVAPTARFLAVVALASRPKGSDNIDSTAFATRRLDGDNRYAQLDSRDRAFARLLVVRVVEAHNYVAGNCMI